MTAVAPNDRAQVWLTRATAPSVVRRALGYAVVVGPILIIINHGGHWLAGQFHPAHLLPMALTMLVPYLVSTFSSVGAMRTSQVDDRPVSIDANGPP